MGGALTVSERILFHLNGYVKYEDKYEVPFDITQDGISQACQISRAHAAIELKKLRDSGTVEEKLCHVRRGKSRRKVYFLTQDGKSRAAHVTQYVRENNIPTGVDPTKISPETTSLKNKSAIKSSPLPMVKGFFGREKELSLLKGALSDTSVKIVAIRGIAGIGKTTLASKLVSGLQGQRVFWYTVKPWDSRKTVADNLAKFFLDNGSRKLSGYMASGRFDLGEFSFLLNDELMENGYTFVFDDADASDDIQEFMMMFKQSSGPAKMVVTCERRPAFFDSADVVARREAVELELTGLDRAAAIDLLASRGITGELAEELAGITKGHPLSLEMVTESSAKEAKYQVSKFFEDKFYSALPEAEKALLQYSSVFQKPFPLEALPKELRQARKGSMLREIAPGMFEIHSSLRSFVYDSMSKDERARWHSFAADHYLQVGDMPERLLHLVRAGRSLEAEMLMARLGEDLIGKGNVQRLWQVLSGFEPAKPRYRASVQLLKAQVASVVGEYQVAAELLREVSEQENGAAKAEALIEMGRIMSKKGELEAAKEFFSRALEQALDSPILRAKALRGMGVVHNKLGKYAKAQELLERSASESMSAMDQKGMLLAHMELGNVFICRGRYEDAISHFTKCAAGFGPVELANVYVNLGIAHAHLGNAEDARKSLENAVRLSEETGQPRCRAYALTSLAEVLLKVNEIERAKEHCFAAIEVFAELGDRLGISAAYANLGMADRKSGDLVASEEHYSESLKAIEGMDVPRSLGLRKWEFGQMLLEKGEHDRAIEMLEASRRLFEAVDAEDMMKHVERDLRKIARKAA